MFPQKRFIIIGLLISVLFTFACAGLPAIENNDTPADVLYGPQISATEHQTQVFESILTRLEESYIHYESSPLDWDKLKQTYFSEINKGITNAEFDKLMNQFETEFGTDEVIYLSRDEKIQALTRVTTAEFVGIGVSVSFQAESEPHLVILDVFPNSPAEKAGIQPHDSIYAVNGELLTVTEGAGITQRIRGEAGTKVELTIQSPGEAKREIEITRAPINGIGELETYQIPDSEIAYILMPSSPSEDTINEVVLALSDYFEEGTAKGLILDLRISNSNSFPIDEMMEVFLDGEVGDVYSRTESRLIDISGQDYFGSQTIPLVVLVGEHTNGTAEAFAAFVESSDRGVVIGSDTNGNIETPVGFALPNGGEIYIASSAIRIKGIESFGLNGFSPQVQNEARWDEINQDEDPLIEQAIKSFTFEEVAE